MKKPIETKVIILVFIIAMLLGMLKIRGCIFFNIFGIPCAGCGLTRSIKALLHFKILESIKYNILGIPLCIFGSVYTILYLFKKTSVVDTFLNRHSKVIIFISVAVFILVWTININNPILYK